MLYAADAVLLIERSTERDRRDHRRPILHASHEGEGDAVE